MILISVFFCLTVSAQKRSGISVREPATVSDEVKPKEQQQDNYDSTFLDADLRIAPQVVDQPALVPGTCDLGGNVEVEATGGTNAAYATLKEAFDAINAGTHTGTITIDVCGNTTETASAVLNASGTGAASYTTIAIAPAGGAARTISGSLPSPLVDLNGADNVTIDGVNTGGNSLTISNTNASTTSTTSTIRFIGGATNNTVTRATILGSFSGLLGTNGGNIFFSTDANTTDGNDNNTISNNNIGPAGANLPTKLIYGNGSVSTAAIRNSGIVVSNNNLYDFFSATTSVSGMNILSGNDNWNIANNRIYQTAARTFTATALRYAGITLNSTTTGLQGAFTITGNKIGFGAADGTGTTTISGSTNLFRGIDAISVNATIPTSIQGNTISGINQTTASTGSSTTTSFIGIIIGTTAGRFDVGTVTGNNVGSLDGSSTISVTVNANGGLLYGIYDFSVSSNTISNNNMGAITIQGTGTTSGFRGIFINTSSTTTATINGNTIGGTNAAGAITDLQVGAYSIYGIHVSLAAGIVTGNTVRNMIGNANSPTAISMSGILVSNTGTTLPNNVSQNSIFGLSNNSGTATGAIYAIYCNFPTVAGNLVARNLVRNISATSTAIGTQMVGILPVAGSAAYQNNMVSLGTDVAGNPITTGYVMYGMFELGGTNNIYHNSVYLSGTGITAPGSNTLAFVSNVTTTPVRNYLNNIFFNGRSNAVAGGASHIALGLSGTTTTNLNSNYNDLYAPGTDGFVGSFNGNAYPTLAGFRTATGTDANSISADPLFVSTTDLHIQAGSPAINAGTTTSVTDDFDGQTRDAAPDIGADEFIVLPPGTLQFGSPTYSVNENGGTATITVTRTDGNAGTVTVDYATAIGGTATGGASCTAGVDYVNTNGTLTFAGGETSKSFTIQICDDSIFEGNETVNLALSNVTGGSMLGTQNTAVLTIVDNEVAMPGTLALSSSTYSVGEGDTSLTVTVNRTGGTDGAVSVPYTLTDGTATGGATCAGSNDYINTGGTVNFAAGQASQTFTVTICEDGVVEGNETFNVNLGTATGGATVGTPSTATVTIVDNDTAPPTGPVTVTATAGTATGTYNNLTEAAAAINAGTHQGAIVVSINQTITEPGTVVINSSGAGSAVYTSILIRPTADNITDSGASAQGRGLIELNGADNVTIDGDNPNTTGINRNLTLQNTAANTVTFTSVIRIALAATVVNSADNNVFKNLNILGSATGRNVSTATSTTASENTTFGIFAGLGGSTTSATTAPAALTSVTTSVGAGATAANLLISNNSIGTAARGVSLNGSATTVFQGMQITGNRVGNQTAGSADQIYSVGITAQGSADGVISSNTVWVESFIPTATQGIAVGINSATGTFTIERNMVNRVVNSNAASYGAYGINLGGGNNHVVQNNFVSGVINSQTAGTGAFSTTFGAFGIRAGSGNGHNIYHNSVNLYGPLPGITNTDLTAAFAVAAVTQTGLDVRNNIFSNQITGGNPTGTRNVAIFLPSGGAGAMNLTLNNNDYFVGTDANNRLAQVGTTFGTGEYTSANFDPTSTTPATNFRAYSSTLSASGTNDNQSKKVDPLFVSASDLHIAVNSPMVDMGANVGVLQDIDGQNRVGIPDIGADEASGTTPLANDIAASVIVSPANGLIIPTGSSVTPQARFVNVGSTTQTNVMVRFTITGPGGFTYTDTQTIATIAPNQTVTVTFAPTPALTAVGTYTTTAAVITPDGNSANDTVTGSFTTIAPINGNINVGMGQTYTSLTNPGGIFEALNLAGASGNVVINITSDLTAETGAVALNELPSGTTLTIKPSGAARTISGSTASTAGLIKLNGADNVTIDGSLNGGTDRSLTINQTGLGAIIWIATTGTNGSNNDTVKNTILLGAGSSQGVIAGDGTTLGGAGTAPQNNNTIQNNAIRAVQNAAYINGIAATDQNWTIVANEAGSTIDADKLSFRGFILINSTNMTVSRNRIIGVNSAANSTATMSGIQVSGTISGGMITRNEIRDIKQNNPTGVGSNGIYSTATSTASNLLIANNFVSDVASQGKTGVLATDNGYGIAIAGGGGYNIYYNSVNMNTNQVSTASTTAALNITVAVTTVGAIDLRDNILVNTQTVGTRYAVIDNSTQGAAVFSTINYNDYFAQNVGFLTSPRVTLADWQAATGQDANSKAVDPLFVSATDLHLQTTSPVLDMGTPIAAVTVDFDGETRSATTPDIGADEIANVVTTPGTLALSSSTYSVSESSPSVTITVNRTGGTDGAVSVNYTLTDGTATGGGTCAGSNDYINTGGTVNFAAGQASQTFSVPICTDAVFEPNETFNVTLSGATGGATIGTPSSAVVTIIDDDVPPPGFIQFSSSLYTGRENGVAIVTVTRTGGTSGTDTVTYTTSNGTAIGGAACTAGVDYILTSGVLTFNPGVTTQTFSVQICPDSTFKPGETINVTLSNATGNSTLGMPSTAVITIIDKARIRNDFDGDGKTDHVVFRASEGEWYILQSSNRVVRATQFGVATDKPVPADYDGDGKTDIAVFRDGYWYILESGTNSFRAEFWGLPSDYLVPADYDGDGKADVAVWRESNGGWYIKRSSNGVLLAQEFGQAGDRPLVGDFDNDGRTELAVARAAAGDFSPVTVFILNTTTQAFRAVQWGYRSDIFVIGDYDGDGKDDVTVYRPSDGAWYVLKSSDNSLLAARWGASTDIPLAGDYDGDGRTDFTVWRPGDGYFYSLLQNGNTLFQKWGQSGDNPLSNRAGY